MHAAGYTCPWVVEPGQRVALHASLPQATHIDLVRIGCANAEQQGDGRPHGPPQRIVPVAGFVSGRHGPAVQLLQPGAQVRADSVALPPWADLALVLAVQRLPRGHGGAVLSLQDAACQGVQIDLLAASSSPARLRIALTGGADALELPLPGSDWLLLTLAIDPHGLRLRSATCRATVPDGVPTTWREIGRALAALPAGAPGTLRLGTRPDAAAADVRLDLVSVLPRSAIEDLSPRELLAGEPAAWERASGPGHCLLRARLGTGRSTQDLAGQATITEAQRPYTAVRGVRWNGRWHDPSAAPTHYSALHFSSDQLLDAHWSPTLSWTLPEDLPSGAYAFRLQMQGDAEPVYASFFVSAAGRARQPLAVLLPTFSYLAYSNAVEDMRGPVVTPAPHAAEQRLDGLHPAHGRSIYERHPDGLGVQWVGSRRPLWSVSPGHRPWQFVADSWLLAWLDRSGQPFDVITDHDLHRLGAAALAPYRVVLSGHHPEYTSTAMWDGLWQYLNSGGRLLYLGGNGWYWRTAVDTGADLIEVRRAEDGTRPHMAAPGESHCAFSGEYGGLWRRLGRPPQQIVGVGMAAQGFERAAHFLKGPDAQALEVAFVFDGVPADRFGESGWWGGGASGWEIDRSDADLGTPVGTWWLGRSEGHHASMMRTKEELLSYVPPFRDAKARSDLVLAPVGLGDVFAVGSMTWIGALYGEDPEPTDVATITANVIRRFLDPAPIARKPAPDR
jgi:N,N-dimethylformamidase